MKVVAVGNNLRVSPKKVILLINEIRKLEPKAAVEILKFMPQAGSPMLQKVINSAIANAKNNYNLDLESLKFEEIQVGKGMIFKRFRAISRGRAHSIVKKTSNIRVVLEGQITKKEEAKKIAASSESNLSNKPDAPKEEKSKEIKEAANGTKS